MTLRKLRQTLHAELRYTQEEFHKHFENRHTTKVMREPIRFSVACKACAQFSERIRTLQFALNEAGGRVRDVTIQPWGPVEGA